MALVLATLSGVTSSAGTDPGMRDTLWFDSVTWDGDTAFSTTMYTATDEALKHATIILGWSSPKIGIDSVSLIGSRWAAEVSGGNGFFVTDTGRVGGVKSATHYNISFIPFTTQLPTGSGPVCRIFWRRSGAVVTDPFIVVDSSATSSGTSSVNTTMFGTSAQPAGNFVSVFKPDTIRVFKCLCPSQGDLTGDGVINVNDVLAVIRTAFSNGPDIHDPYCPRSRADVTGEGIVNVNDVLYLIKTAFSNGPAPVNPCAP
jgi:hypothetical protein